MRKHGVIPTKIYFSLNCHTLYIDSLFYENGMKNEDRNKHWNQNRGFQNEVLNVFKYAAQRRDCSKSVSVICFYSL